MVGMKTELSQTNSEIDLRTISRPTKRQSRFIDAYLDPVSDTFGNAYQSALVAGFSKNYALNITANTRNTPWVNELKQLLTRYEPEHIYRAMQHIALNGKQDRDRLRALELMGKHTGMFIERSQSEVNVSFTNHVPRPTPVEVEITTPPTDKDLT